MPAASKQPGELRGQFASLKSSVHKVRRTIAHRPANKLVALVCCALQVPSRTFKEQMMLFADRTSTFWMRSNQIRLYFSTVAYLLMQGLRRLGLAGTELAKAQCNTVLLKLLKIGAQIRITVRKIWVSLSTGYPYLELFRQVYRQLQVAALRC